MSAPHVSKKPCKSLRQIREAAYKSQSEFAEDLEVSVAYVQAIEQGSRAPSREFAVNVMGHYGAWWQCVADNWAQAVDLNGQPYSTKFYNDFISDTPESMSSDDVAILLDPVRRLVLAAAGIGKVRLFAFWLKDALTDGVHTIRNLGYQAAKPVETKITFGELRADEVRAAAMGFTDDPTRANDDVAVILRNERPALFGYGYPDDRDLSCLAERYKMHSKLTE